MSIIETIKVLEGNIGRTLTEIVTIYVCFWSVSSGKGNKSKNKQMRPFKPKRFCTVKWNKKPTYWMGENAFKLYDREGLLSKIYEELIQCNI